MRILVVEDTIGNSTDVILDLVEAGHRVVRCQPLGGTVEPCAGLVGATCPLDEPVDVTVQFHDADEDLTMRGLGLLCSGRAGIPIVNVGPEPSRVAAVDTTPDRLVATLAEMRLPR